MTKLGSNFLFLFVFLSFISVGQLYTTTMYNLEDLCKDVISWPGMEVIDVEYSGSANAIGFFKANGSNVLLEEGIILTTGTVLDEEINSMRRGPHGPNDEEMSGIDNGTGGHEVFEFLTEATTYNAAVLQLTFIATDTILPLQYVFGSEEYPTYVCSQFNDVFGILLEGPGYLGKENIALIPGKNIPVSINAVNSGEVGETLNSNASFCSEVDPDWQENVVFYRENGDGSTYPYSVNAGFLQYNGLTNVLSTDAALVIGEEYVLTIAIADVGDGVYDSGLFIRTNTIETAGTRENSQDIKVAVYPNPGNGEFTVLLKGVQNSSYAIIDALGRVIQTGSLFEGQNKIDFMQKEKGVYYLEVSTSTDRFVERIVVN